MKKILATTLISCFTILNSVISISSTDESLYISPIAYISLDQIEENEQDIICDVSNEDIELLSLILVAEAENQPEYGQRLVVDTVLNRIDSDDFPNTVSEVIYQKYAFSSIWNGRINRCNVTDNHRGIVIDELTNRTNFEILYFTAGKYGKYGTPLFNVEDHYFSGK